MYNFFVPVNMTQLFASLVTVFKEIKYGEKGSSLYQKIAHVPTHSKIVEASANFISSASLTKLKSI